MSSPHDNRVRIAEPAAKAAQSRVRKQFNTLVKKLESERARLSAWQAFLPELHGMVEQELQPLERAADASRKQLMLLLDQAHAHKLMGKREKAKLEDLICILAEVVLEHGDDADVSAIYERHGGDAFDMDETDDDLFKDMLEDLMGSPLGDDVDLNSPDAVMAALHARMDEQAREEAAAREAAQAAAEQAPKKPKSAKASAREQRLEAEEKRMQQSVREIYRKLASALHPDREPDVAERARKTGLMQRVNVAYAANDLLGLLELQLEVEQLDQAGLDRMDDARIKQFNKVLAGQVAELERDNADLEFALIMDFEIDAYQRPTPESVLRLLREGMETLRASNRAMEEDMAAFQDIKALKAWLKTYRIQPRESDFDDVYYY
ncbi:J domain-containing protein [Pseudoduganella sp. LjRoot289]|uniref:J domain-containing protein n=1 Tax=Pseudoduganella sp. LjRoot289 TaxID=3342314 RepID=UPI003ECC1BD6